ncbi:flavoprotein [Candidatus Protochlamydia sp. W-9]|uniref:flavoprotein n=1 Tax=Candidatus Protochlamydia sp. W-9 TaxID=1785087 RepID=UPI00096A89BA|nr:flavoprotein [Candidatus Protochlamydia sp. W-9]
MTKLLVGMTGSMGMLSMPPYLLMLREYFSEIKIIMSHSATHFLPTATLSMFSNGIYTNEFPISNENMMHIELARWAELFVVIPATANVLSEAAQGMAGTLLTTTILAYEKKIIFIPNMNSAMWRNKALQRNILLLEQDNHMIVPPLERPSFEYASRSIEVNHVMPTPETILSILQLEIELGRSTKKLSDRS